MRYYIFGNTKDSSSIVASKKSAAFSSTDIDVAYEKYKSYIKEARFTNVYFVVDFELYGKMFTSFSLNDSEDTPIPFFVIGDWHGGGRIIRNDCTVISRKGFDHEFNNNLSAMKEFLYCIDNHIQCDFRILYKKSTTGNGITNRLIVDSVDLIRNKKIKPIFRFKLSKISWTEPSYNTI